jgi:hypothetical protein
MPNAEPKKMGGRGTKDNVRHQQVFPDKCASSVIGTSLDTAIVASRETIAGSRKTGWCKKLSWNFLNIVPL